MMCTGAWQAPQPGFARLSCDVIEGPHLVGEDAYDNIGLREHTEHLLQAPLTAPPANKPIVSDQDPLVRKSWRRGFRHLEESGLACSKVRLANALPSDLPPPAPS